MPRIPCCRASASSAASNSVPTRALAVRLEHRHPPHLPPLSGFALGRGGEAHQPAGADGVSALEGQDVEGARILRVPLDALRDVLFLDEDDLADGERLHEVRLVADWRNDDGWSGFRH